MIISAVIFFELIIVGNLFCSIDGFSAEFDGYLLLDFVASAFYVDDFAWYENDGASDPTWTAQDIATSADGARSVYAADMDGDGDMDIVSASNDDNTIAWYENDGASDPSWSYESIATSADGAYDVFVVDMDNDGDLDILTCEEHHVVGGERMGLGVIWYENPF